MNKLLGEMEIRNDFAWEIDSHRLLMAIETEGDIRLEENSNIDFYIYYCMQESMIVKLEI